MKSDTSIWINLKRMRTTIKSLATLILTLVALNGYYMIQEKNWVVFVIDIIYGIIVIPIFFSLAKWQKSVPREEEVKVE